MVFNISLYLSLAICVLGLGYKLIVWFKSKRDSNEKDASTGKRVSAFFASLGRQLASPKGWARFWSALLLDVLLLRRSFKLGPMRWAMHMLIFYGFMGLLLMHALQAQISEAIFDEYYATINPFLFLRNLFGIMALAGIAMAIWRRCKNQTLRKLTKGLDIYAIVILAVIMLSGFLLEGSKIISAQRYQEMVEEYAGLDEEEAPALKAYWAKNYGVVFSDLKGPFEEELLEQGAELNEDNCVSCHSQPQAAFISYPVSRILAPMAAWLDQAGAPNFLWYLHFLACFVGLAYLPFSKFLHVVTTPVSLTVNALSQPDGAQGANLATRHALDMDACTHCSACSEHCSVGTIFKKLQNLAILPSEKLALSRKMLNWNSLDDSSLRLLRQGADICTNCLRCTLICPAGLDLQQLWFDIRTELDSRGYPDTYQWTRDNCPAAPEPDDEPLEIGVYDWTDQLGYGISQEDFSKCFQCQSCTNVCPVVAGYENPAQELGLLPHQIMQALSLGLTKEARAARMTWDCLTCYLCQEHCPQRVPVTDVLYTLRNQAFDQLNQAKVQE